MSRIKTSTDSGAASKDAGLIIEGPLSRTCKLSKRLFAVLDKVTPEEIPKVDQEKKRSALKVCHSFNPVSIKVG